MPVRRFPDPRSATRDGLVAVGGDLEPATLRLAYEQGIFPWPVQGLPLLWFSPAERGVLEFASLRVPRSLARARRKDPFRLTIDADFPGVIRACASTPRPGQDGTWITDEIVAAYVRLHRLGIAHSVEAWAGARLVGGSTAWRWTAPSPRRACSTGRRTPPSSRSCTSSTGSARAVWTGSTFRCSRRTWLASGLVPCHGTSSSGGWRTPVPVACASSSPGGSATPRGFNRVATVLR